MISDINFLTLIGGTAVVALTFIALTMFVLFHNTRQAENRRQATSLLDEQTDMATRLTKARRLAYLSALSGGMAYYLDSILFDINGLIDMMYRPGGRHDLEKLVGMTADKATLGLRVTDQLQQFARPQNLKLSAISLNSLVVDAINQVRVHISHEIEIATYMDAQSDIIIGDAPLLRQTIVNILTNSADAIDGEGLITVEIAKHTVPEGAIGDSAAAYIGQKQLAIKISDNGRGMGSEVAKHVFQPFFTTRSNADRLGLGLAYVLGIANMHGGTIDLQSTQAVGTTMSLYFNIPTAEQISQLTQPSKHIDDSHFQEIIPIEDKLAALKQEIGSA